MRFRLDDQECRFLLRRGPAEDVVATGWHIDDHASFEQIEARIRAHGVPVVRGSDEEAALRAWNASFGSPAPRASPRRSTPPADLRRTAAHARVRLRHRRLRHGTHRAHLHQADADPRLLQHRLRRPSDRLHRRDDQRRQTQDPLPARQRTPPLHRGGRHPRAARRPDPHPRPAPQHPGRHSGRRRQSYQRVHELGFDMALSVGQHTNDKELSYYARTPSGFEWEVGWNPIVIDETTWEPSTHQGISVWATSPSAGPSWTSSPSSAPAPAPSPTRRTRCPRSAARASPTTDPVCRRRSDRTPVPVVHGRTPAPLLPRPSPTGGTSRMFAPHRRTTSAGGDHERPRARRRGDRGGRRPGRRRPHRRPLRPGALAPARRRRRSRVRRAAPACGTRHRRRAAAGGPKDRLDLARRAAATRRGPAGLRRAVRRHGGARGTVDRPRPAPPAEVEAEVALVLGTDLPHRAPTVADLLRATAFALPALEIVDSRIADWDITIVDTVADNASCGLYVLGGTPVPLDRVDLRAVTMTLTKNGETVSEGTGATAWAARSPPPSGSPPPSPRSATRCGSATSS